MTELLSQVRLVSGMPFGLLFILVSLVGLNLMGFIVPSFPGDPDLWDGRLGFARQGAR